MTFNRTFLFLLKQEKFVIPMYFKRISEVSENIFLELCNFGKYQVKSNVQNQNFQLFLNYWQTQTLPQIDFNNYWDFYLLSQEFEIMSEYLSSPQFDRIHKISIIRYLSPNDPNIADKCNVERSIAQNLDSYLANMPNELFSIQVPSLYNIFYHNERVLNNYNEAYSVIARKSDENPAFGILLQSIDADSLSKELFIDSVLKRENRLGYTANITPRFVQIFHNLIDEATNKSKRLEKDIIDLKKKHENEKKSLISLYENEKKSLKASYEKEKKSLNALHEKEKKSLIDLNENKIKSLNQSFAKEKELFAQKYNQLEQNFDALKEKYEQKSKECEKLIYNEKVLKVEFDKVKEKCEKQVEEQKLEYEKDKEIIKSRTESLENKNKQLSQRIQMLKTANNEINDIEKNMEEDQPEKKPSSHTKNSTNKKTVKHKSKRIMSDTPQSSQEKDSLFTTSYSTRMKRRKEDKFESFSKTQQLKPISKLNKYKRGNSWDIMFIIDVSKSDAYDYNEIFEKTQDMSFNFLSSHRNSIVRFSCFFFDGNSQILNKKHSFDDDYNAFTCFLEESNNLIEEDDESMSSSNLVDYNKILNFALDNFEWENDNKAIILISGSKGEEKKNILQVISAIADEDYIFVCLSLNENAQETFNIFERIYTAQHGRLIQCDSFYDKKFDINSQLSNVNEINANDDVDFI